MTYSWQQWPPANTPNKKKCINPTNPEWNKNTSEVSRVLQAPKNDITMSQASDMSQDDDIGWHLRYNGRGLFGRLWCSSYKVDVVFFVSPPRWKEKWNCHKFKHCQSYLLGKDFFLYVYLLFCCYCCCCCSQEFMCWKFANSSCNFLSGSGSCPKMKFHLMVYHSIRLSPMSTAGGSLGFFNPSTHPANRLTGCVVPLLGVYSPNKI